jgi:putative transposase
MMTRHDPDRRRRRSIRLPGYDYRSPGAYFVTLCTRGRECVLDDFVVTGIISDVWRSLPGWFPAITLDEFVVMPNHVHLIVWLHSSDDGAGASPAPTQTNAGDDVGATLAVAPDTAAPDAVTPHSVNPHAAAPDILAPHRAGASPAPTQTDADDDVRATARVAPDAVAPYVVAPDTVTLDSVALWTIPAPERINPNPTLGDVIGAFKSLVFTVYLDWIQANDPTRQAKFWQRNYYEHIIRNERELHAIRHYIRDNPAQWALDRDNPLNFRHMSAPRRVEDYVADIQALLEDGDGE